MKTWNDLSLFVQERTLHHVLFDLLAEYYNDAPAQARESALRGILLHSPDSATPNSFANPFTT